VKRILRPTARVIALAMNIVLPLAGCIRSQGPLLPTENASTPLPAGLYFSVSNLNSGSDFPAVRGPVRVRTRGNVYIATPEDPGDKPLRFHLIELARGSNVYILQTDADDKRGYRDILIGVVGKDGFCSKDIRDFPVQAVTDHDVVSKQILLHWLADKASEIPSMANDVCFVRRT
jgi:hypothetical protein